MGDSAAKRLLRAAKKDGGIEKTNAKARRGAAAQPKPNMTRIVDAKGNVTTPDK